MLLGNVVVGHSAQGMLRMRKPPDVYESAHGPANDAHRATNYAVFYNAQVREWVHLYSLCRNACHS